MMTTRTSPADNYCLTWGKPRQLSSGSSVGDSEVGPHQTLYCSRHQASDTHEPSAHVGLACRSPSVRTQCLHSPDSHKQTTITTRNTRKTQKHSHRTFEASSLPASLQFCLQPHSIVSLWPLSTYTAWLTEICVRTTCLKSWHECGIIRSRISDLLIASPMTQLLHYLTEF